MRFQTPTKLELFLDGFRDFVAAWECYTYDAFVCQKFVREEFWQTLSRGWMDEYIYPYDDPYNRTISQERKLRLGNGQRLPHI